MQEGIEAMPYLKKRMLVTRNWEKSVPFYEELTKMLLEDTTPGLSIALIEMKEPGALTQKQCGGKGFRDTFRREW